MSRFRFAEENYPYFVTCSIVKWLSVFVSSDTCDVIIKSLEYCRAQRGLRIHAYVIMPTHLHLIVSAEADISGVVRDFKKFTAREIIAPYTGTQFPPFENAFRFCGEDNRPPTAHKVWQDGSHPELIKTEAFFRQKADYIRANPSRKGLVTDPLAWRYSSLRFFAGVENGEPEPLAVDFVEW